MNRSFFAVTGLFCASLVLSGCPNYAFTSADNSRGLYGLLDAVALGGDVLEDSATQEAVREVVEPDVIRQDGNLLYILNQYRGLMVVDLAQRKVLGEAATYGFPRDLYLAGDRAYVLVAEALEVSREEDTVNVETGSRLYVVDVSAPGSMSILGQFDFDGDLVDSRVVGDILYAVSAEYVWTWAIDGEGVAVSSVAKQQTSSTTWVSSFDLSDPENIQAVDRMDFEGEGTVIHATNSALFVSAPDWETSTSQITYVDIADPGGAMAVRGQVDLPGYVPDRYKMDAYEGVLRVVSFTSWPDRQVYIDTIDLADPDALTVLGSTTIENAEDETLYATRFDGPRAYVVTYLVQDPLFVIDLSVPSAPVVAGELVVPGWSTYIQPQGDRLIALGVDDTDGRNVSVSLYDVEDPSAPALLARENFGEDWSWSSAYEDVKAFTVLDDLLLVPFSGWNESGGYDRLQFLPYTHDTLSLGGYVDVEGAVVRSLAYEGSYFTVTQEQLAAINADDPATPTVEQRVTLAEYVEDYYPLGDGYAAWVVTQRDAGKAFVRTVDAAGDTVGALEVPLKNLAQIHRYQDLIVLVSTDWDGSGAYELSCVDVSETAAPALAKTIRVDVQPYGGGWWWDGPLLLEDDVRVKQYWPNYFSEGMSLLAGNTLALRCLPGEVDSTVGEGAVQQGLALVDLDALELQGVVGLGSAYIDSVAAQGSKIYITECVPVAGLDFLAPRCAYLLREFDPASGTAGPAVNVPGRFLHYDTANGTVLLEDVQYDVLEAWSLSYSLKSARWDGGDSVESVDSLDLGNASGDLLVRGGKVFYGSYNGGYGLSAVLVGADGSLDAGDDVTVSTGTWSVLLDAGESDAYVQVGGRLIARYGYDGVWALEEVFELMGYPGHIRFGEDTAYATLGYAGLAELSSDSPASGR